MKYLNIGGVIPAPEIALGCMRLSGLSRPDAEKLIRTALDLGVHFFDHADIYGGGACETIFAEAAGMTPSLREQMLIQTKCGIRPGQYDFSREHILASVDASLKRLRTDYVDFLLLHRPDTLMEPEEVAEAFRLLKREGKVRFFGVSNQNAGQMTLLSKYCVETPLLVNQLQFSMTECGIIDAGLNVNMTNSAGVNRGGGILEFCRLNEITIQPWSPFQYGFFEGVFLGSDKFPQLNQKVNELAEKYSAAPEAIAIAWILRHPARMQPIVGTTSARRLTDICKASEITLTRQEWYELYLSAGKKLP